MNDLETDCRPGTMSLYEPEVLIPVNTSVKSMRKADDLEIVLLTPFIPNESVTCTVMLSRPGKLGAISINKSVCT